MTNKAFDNDLVGGDVVKVFKRVKKLFKGDANARDRVLSGEEFNKLIAALHGHTNAIVPTGYSAGLSRGEVLKLTWDKVDLKNPVIRLNAAGTKDKETRSVPICSALYEILKKAYLLLHGRCSSDMIPSMPLIPGRLLTKWKAF